MGIPILSDLLKNTVGKAVEGLIQKYLPASASEQERLAFQLELGKTQLELEKLFSDQDQNFRSSINGYESPARLSKWMLDYRASVRPNLTYLCAIHLTYLMIRYKPEVLVKLPWMLWAIYGTVFVFWFGDRFLTRTGLVDKFKVWGSQR